MKSILTRDERGVTLVELMAVVAIIGLLAAIVMPVVSGTGEKSREGRSKGDATTLESALGDFFSGQEGAESIQKHSYQMDFADFVNSAGSGLGMNTSTDQVQAISSRWPETFIAKTAAEENNEPKAAYNSVFNSGNTVATIQLLLDDDTALSEVTLLTKYTAVNFGVLTGLTDISIDDRSRQFLRDEPSSASETSEGFSNYLWLLRKATSPAGTKDDFRSLEVFKLLEVEKIETGLPDAGQFELIYKQIF